MSKCKLLVLAALFIASSAAAETVNVQLFFSLSKPQGGAISLHDWEQFERGTLSSTFNSFTVVNATGFHQRQIEHNKLVMIVIDDADMPKVEWVAQIYAQHFGQNSVMMLKTPVIGRQFISPPMTSFQRR